MTKGERWREYERRKADIARRAGNAADYQRMIRALAKALGL